MKCPYLTKTIQFTQSKNTYGDEGVETSKNAFTEYIRHSDCLKEECVAWQDSKCCYKG